MNVKIDGLVPCPASMYLPPEQFISCCSPERAALLFSAGKLALPPSVSTCNSSPLTKLGTDFPVSELGTDSLTY